jgi:hypothetical protein
VFSSGEVECGVVKAKHTCEARSRPLEPKDLIVSTFDAAQQASLAQLVERGTSISGSCRGHRFDSVRRHCFLPRVERACKARHLRLSVDVFGVAVVVYLHKVWRRSCANSRVQKLKKLGAFPSRNSATASPTVDHRTTNHCNIAPDNFLLACNRATDPTQL